MELNEKIRDKAYDVSSHIEEALMCLDDIEDEWRRGEEISTSRISVMRDDLKNAMHKANQIDIALKHFGHFMETTEEMLNDNY